MNVKTKGFSNSIQGNEHGPYPTLTLSKGTYSHKEYKNQSWSNNINEVKATLGMRINKGDIKQKHKRVSSTSLFITFLLHIAKKHITGLANIHI